MTRTLLFLALGLALAPLLSCQGNLVPLPSGSVGTDLAAADASDGPMGPNSTLVLASALTVDGDPDADQPVALVGLPGAVTGKGLVRVTLLRTGIEEQVHSHDSGTFAHTVLARGGDEVRVAFSLEDSDAVSEPIVLVLGSWADAAPDVVDSVDGQDGGGGAAADAAEQAVPLKPKIPGSADAKGAEPEWEMDWVSDTELEIVGLDGYVNPGDGCMVANMTLGAGDWVASDANGAIAIRFAASPGDQLMVFSTSDDGASSPPFAQVAPAQ